MQTTADIRPDAHPPTMEHLLRRIQSEFREMPGLRLTCRQAQRLWDLDQLVCESLLAALVDVRFLVERDGIFLQSADLATGTGRPKTRRNG